MDEIWMPILLCLVMLIGCYAAGYVSLAFHILEVNLKLMIIFNAGLLIGTALSVIIPEGVYSLIHQSDHDTWHSLEIAASSSKSSKSALKLNAAVPAAQAGNMLKSVQHNIESHTFIGVALVLGFVLMLLIDQIGGSLSTFSGNNSGVHTRSTVMTTLEFIMRTIADGVALGAAASASHAHVAIIVFIVIMLHNAPAAFGLVSFLLQEGYERSYIHRRLGIFSVSTPLLALILYFGIGQSSKDGPSDLYAAGLSLLFSGGTYLYLATVHILPEVAQMRDVMSSSLSSSQLSSPLDDSIITEHHHHIGFKKRELVVIVIGCVLPLLANFAFNN